MIKRGQGIGKSGSTGPAGGDHLHFSMQVDGVQVNPIEVAGRSLDQRSRLQPDQESVTMPTGWCVTWADRGVNPYLWAPCPLTSKCKV
jgi:murein DD-endopeptidase MepM/ murein hydrolase activator NlpD